MSRSVVGYTNDTLNEKIVYTGLDSDTAITLVDNDSESPTFGSIKVDVRPEVLGDKVKSGNSSINIGTDSEGVKEISVGISTDPDNLITLADDGIKLSSNDLATEEEIQEIRDTYADKDWVEDYIGDQNFLHDKDLDPIREEVDNKQDKLIAGDNITIEDNVISADVSGLSYDYRELTNKPRVNGVELIGNKTSDDLGITLENLGIEDYNYATRTELNKEVTDSSNAIHTWVENNYRTANDQDIIDATKQDVISDLDTIRSGAALGTTSIQPNDNISELTNDAGYITKDVNDLTNYYAKDDLMTKEETLQELANKQDKITEDNKLSPDLIDGLATVATSGDYDDLTHKPTKTSDFINDGNGDIDSSGLDIPFSTMSDIDRLDKRIDDLVVEGGEPNKINHIDVNGHEVLPGLPDKTVFLTIPTETSDLTNDSGFITKDVNDLTNYYTKTEVDTDFYTKDQVYTKTEIDADHYNKDEIDLALSQKQDELTAGTGISIEVDSSGQTIISNTQTSAEWGNIEGNLSDQIDLANALDSKVDKVEGYSLMSESEHSKLEGIESGAQVNILEGVKVNGTVQTITDKEVDITVPTKVSDLNNDSDFQTGVEVEASISANNANYVDVELAKKQDELTAGDGIDIYTDSTGALIIENTNVSAEWGNIQGTLSNQTDLQNALDDKVDKEVGYSLMSDAEHTKLEDIESGAQVNIIEDVKVNGTSLTVTDKSVDVTVPTKVSDLTNDLNFQTDTDVASSIGDHNTSSTAHNDIRQSITTEVTNRENADTYLQEQIDAITSSSDVVDIVGTYAELLAYDTSHLNNNDIIKVLLDSTHDDAISYYRWVFTLDSMGQPIIDSMGNHVGTWNYIGSQGPFYTKSETDQTFVPQTRTVNNKALSTNISLDYSDVGALPDSTVIGNGTVTIQKNSTTVDSFTLNQTADKTIDIPVPTKTSDLTNDGDGTSVFTTSSDVSTAISNHNTDQSAHSYIQGLISDEVTARENADTALDGRLTTVENNYVSKTRKINGHALSSDIDLTYEDVGAVGLPETLNDQEFLYRQTPASQDGVGRIDTIKGNTVKFNQLVSQTMLRPTNTVNGVTFTNNSDGSFTINGTATAIAEFDIVIASNPVIVPAGHAIYFKDTKNQSNVCSYYLKDGNGTTIVDRGNDGIYILQNANVRFWVRVESGTSVSNFKIYPQIFDLTAMGIDNLTTTTEVEEWLSTHLGLLPYYDYTQGSLIPFRGTGLKTTGKNFVALKENISIQGLTFNYTNGYLVVNGSLSANNNIEIATDIIIKEEATYTFSGISGGSTTTYLLQLRNSEDIIVSSLSSGSKTLTLSPDRYRVTLRIIANVQITNLEVKPQLEFGSSETTTYEPYTESTLSLPISTYFSTGMKEAGNVYDELTGSKAITRVGSIDLGSLTWTYNDTSRNFMASITDIKHISDTSVLNAVCIPYTNVASRFSGASAGQNMTIAKSRDSQGNNDKILISNTDYTDATSFKTAMSGVMLYYELATPTSQDISIDLTYDVWNDGTEQILPINTSTPTTSPIIADITYSMFDLDVGKGILTIQKNSSSIGTFSANANNNTTINIPVPTQLSDLSDTYYTAAEIDTLWANTTI